MSDTDGEVPPVVLALRALSPREDQVLAVLTRGASYKCGAETLGMSINTFRARVKILLLKSHAHSIREAMYNRSRQTPAPPPAIQGAGRLRRGR